MKSTFVIVLITDRNLKWSEGHHFKNEISLFYLCDMVQSETSMLISFIKELSLIMYILF